MFSHIPLARTLSVLVVTALLAACGKSGGDAKPASQVAAKVNSDEITVHQINQGMARAGRLAPEQTRAASRQVLEQLIDQQLLVQKAIEGKLDRSPEVVASLEAARLRILAQAHMDKALSSALGKPAPEDIRKFHDARPDLFAERRIYRLQEMVTNAGPDKERDLIAQVQKAKSLNDVVNYLRGNDIKFTANAMTRPAEQLPLDALPMLGKMKDGEFAALRGGGRVTIIQRVSAILTPLSLEEATPYIEQFLVNQKRTELAAAEVRQLRQGAKMEYLGEFSQPAATASATTRPAGNGPVNAVMPASAGTSRPAAVAGAPAANGGDNAFEKGLKGLK